jgi:subfamily B ATP-binding cassette protein HlyB/CyaB
MDGSPTTIASLEGSDTGAKSLARALRFLNVPINAEQLAHELGHAGAAMTAAELVRAARHAGMKSRLVRPSAARLPTTPLPALAGCKDGGWCILVMAGPAQVLVQDPVQPRPESLTRAAFEDLWDGRLILLARRPQGTDPDRRFDVTWFFPAIRKYKALFGEVLIASLFLQLLALGSPMFFQVVLDKVVVHRTLDTLDVLMVGLVAMATFEVILGGLRTYVFSHTTNRVDVELGARLFKHLLALPTGYFEMRPVGDSVAKARELENIRGFLTGSALTLAIDLVFTVVFIGVMFYFSATLTWITLTAFPAYIGISVVATPMLRRRLNEKYNRGAENQAFLVETVGGIETLKAMAVEPLMQRRWEEQLAGYVSASFRTQNIGNIANQAVTYANRLCTAAILYFGARLVISGELTIGGLVAFNMLAARVSAPVLRMAQLWQDFQQFRISVQRVGSILNTPPEPMQRAAALPRAIRGHVAFDDVVFRYRPNGAPVLENINIRIPAGQVVGIVGSSGSGKSTLAKLVQRLYLPEQGRVMIDGIDLSLVDIAWLRRQIGVVLQDNVLFARSIRENIALGSPGARMERVIAAAELSGAHDFIAELPQAYDTVIGERGGSLSGGQRQRIAIARALIGNPRILIFDEATSALDYESERLIQNNMRRICAGRTVLIIAHRLSAVRFADRILSIERGRIVEDGSHDELIRGDGRYSQLHRAQGAVHEVA